MGESTRRRAGVLEFRFFRHSQFFFTRG